MTRHYLPSQPSRDVRHVPFWCVDGGSLVLTPFESHSSGPPGSPRGREEPRATTILKGMPQNGSFAHTEVKRQEVGGAVEEEMLSRVSESNSENGS